MQKIRVGSRESRLALLQTEIVINKIKEKISDVEFEIVTMKTTGDKILDKTLDKVGGKGLFVKELDRALLDGEVDLAVHSLKDVPMEVDDRIPILAYTGCEASEDVLVLPKGCLEIDFKKPIGSSSARRNIQLKKLYPQALISPVRGNVQTRLKKLDEGEFSALVLARAGLNRLGLSDRISRIFSVEEMLPAAGQGVLAVQGRCGFRQDVIEAIDNKISRYQAEAERSFVGTLDGGCTLPTAAHAVLSDDILTLTGLFVNEKGEEIRSCISGSVDERIELGRKLAYKVKGYK